MGKELDSSTTFYFGKELHFVREIGGDFLTFPNPNVLLKLTFFPCEIDLRNSWNMVDLQRNLHSNPSSDLGSAIAVFGSGRRRRRRQIRGSLGV